jgi:FAD/FMN-containing dehydrogenase
VYGVVKVKTEDDIRAALSYARENGLKVSIAGVRHSMGGQAFAKRRYDPLLIFTNTFYEKYGLTTVP